MAEFTRRRLKEIECSSMVGMTTAERRALVKAVRERDGLLEREAHFTKVLRVADGGQYRNDWDAAIRRVVEERGAFQQQWEVKESEREECSNLLKEVRASLHEAQLKIRAADVVMVEIDRQVRAGRMDARSAIADARLDYGDPP